MRRIAIDLPDGTRGLGYVSGITFGDSELVLNGDGGAVEPQPSSDEDPLIPGRRQSLWVMCDGLTCMISESNELTRSTLYPHAGASATIVGTPVSIPHAGNPVSFVRGFRAPTVHGDPNFYAADVPWEVGNTGLAVPWDGLYRIECTYDITLTGVPVGQAQAGLTVAAGELGGGSVAHAGLSDGTWSSGTILFYSPMFAPRVISVEALAGLWDINELDFYGSTIAEATFGPCSLTATWITRAPETMANPHFTVPPWSGGFPPPPPTGLGRSAVPGRAIPGTAKPGD